MSRFFSILFILIGLAASGVAIALAADSGYVSHASYSCRYSGGSCYISDEALRHFSSSVKTLDRNNVNQTVAIGLAVGGGVFFSLGLFIWASGTTRRKYDELLGIINAGSNAANPLKEAELQPIPKIFCTNCGTACNVGEASCPKCGNSLD